MSATKEQIEEAKTGARKLVDIYGSGRGSVFFSDHAHKQYDIGEMMKTLLNALTTAEQERDLYEKSIDGWKFRAKHAEARVKELEAIVGDLSALVRKLVHHIGPENMLSKRAMDYLLRKGLQGSPLRDVSTEDGKA